MDLVHADGVAKGKALPVTIGLGTDYYEGVKASAEGTLKRLEDWVEVMTSTDFRED